MIDRTARVVANVSDAQGDALAEGVLDVLRVVARRLDCSLAWTARETAYVVSPAYEEVVEDRYRWAKGRRP